MTEQIDVSVVMSVYNGAQLLRESVDSILSQDGVSLELIVVDDGSTDQSGRIMHEYADRDSRVRVVHQENQGLTRALITGCAAAHGEYIARQDAGDVSLPGRLVKELAALKEIADASLISCGTRFVGPAGEYLYDVTRVPQGATKRLLTLDLEKIEGPSSHPSTMFPKAVYERVGGYRPVFYFAQDLDLWIRLTEQGEHVVLPEVLYQKDITVQSISGLYRKEQIKTARVILESARRRRSGEDDADVLEKAKAIRPLIRRQGSPLARARWLYFMGSCLRKNGNPKSRDYFKRALMSYPFHIKSAIRLLLH